MPARERGAHGAKAELPSRTLPRVWHRTLVGEEQMHPPPWAPHDPLPTQGPWSRALGAACLACSHPFMQACGVRGHRLPRPTGPSVSSGLLLLLLSPGAFLPEAGRGLRGAWPPNPHPALRGAFGGNPDSATCPCVCARRAHLLEPWFQQPKARPSSSTTDPAPS